MPPIGDLTLDPEDFFLVVHQLGWGGKAAAAGAAGTRTMVALTMNAVLTDRIAIVERIEAACSVATGINIRQSRTPLGWTNANQARFRDGQWKSPTNSVQEGPVVLFRNDVGVLGDLVTDGIKIPANSTYPIAVRPVILVADDLLIICTDTDQRDISATFYWRVITSRIR